jgi:hypothetical protein
VPDAVRVGSDQRVLWIAYTHPPRVYGSLRGALVEDRPANVADLAEIDPADRLRVELRWLRRVVYIGRRLVAAMPRSQGTGWAHRGFRTVRAGTGPSEVFGGPVALDAVAGVLTAGAIDVWSKATNRAREIEADVRGQELATAAGFRHDAGLTTLPKIAALAAHSSFLSAHPAGPERENALRQGSAKRGSR